MCLSTEPRGFAGQKCLPRKRCRRRLTYILECIDLHDGSDPICRKHRLCPSFVHSFILLVFLCFFLSLLVCSSGLLILLMSFCCCFVLLRAHCLYLCMYSVVSRIKFTTKIGSVQKCLPRRKCMPTTFPLECIDLHDGSAPLCSR